MARDQDAQQVPAHVDPDLLRGHITVQAPGEAAIGDRLPIRHLRYQIPHATLRHAAVGSERQVELPSAAGQVFPRGLAIVRSMPKWQKRIFTALVRNSGSPAADFCLPAERTLSVATLIEI